MTAHISASPSCVARHGRLLEQRRVTLGASSASGRRPRGVAASTARGSLTIFGAASLKGALDKAKAAYETANPGTTINVSTDSSSALETKIEQGAPADVFLSADTTNPKKLVDKGLAAGDAVDFAGNKLTVIVPTANPAASAPRPTSPRPA